MNPIQNGEKTIQNRVVLLALLSAIAVGIASAQSKEEKSSPRSASKPSSPAQNVGAPAAQSSTNNTSGPSRTPRAPHMGANPVATRTTAPNTTVGKKTTIGIAGRPGTGTGGTTATGTLGQTGGVVAKAGTGTTGKSGAASTTGKTGSPTTRAGGTTTVAKTVNLPAPGRQVLLKGGGMAIIRPDGQIRSISQNGMHIEHGLNGSRRIESTRNRVRIVSTGKNSGYVQRAYVTRNGYTYVSRTTVVNNVTHTTVYRSYSYGGYCCYYVYYPAYYYAPVYYGWAYNPWPAPVYYVWGWGSAPWYGYYGWYFAPYPVYPSAAFWLTDYLIAANLQAAYAAQAESNSVAANAAVEQTQASAGNSAPAANSGSVTLSPEVKQAIAGEVKAELAAEQVTAEAGSSSEQPPSPSREEVPPALDPARRTFIVSTDLAVTADGQECELTQGDVITRISDTPDQDRKVNASVSASKKGDCAAGKQVAVGVDDLQEMRNHFQQQVDDGMKELASKQGTDGVPKASNVSTVASEIQPPSHDPTAVKTLQDQQAIADQTEAQVVKEAFSQGS